MTTETPVASIVPVEPTIIPTTTATSFPLAMLINGQGIPLIEFEVQKFQLESALSEMGKNIEEEDVNQQVLDYMIIQELLAQGARSLGFAISAEEIDIRIADLIEQTGGESTFNQWLTDMGYSMDTFRSAYQRELEAAWQRDQVVSSVSENAEQIHALQILVRDIEVAQAIYRQIQAGAEFATLAIDYDPLLKGELGWFPRGYLFLPEIDEAVFRLTPGQYTEIIETEHGYHIVQVVEREESYPLSKDALQVLRQNALNKWIVDRRSQSQIEVLIP